MNKIPNILLIMILSGLSVAASLRKIGPQSFNSSRILGSIISLNAEFDIYRVREGSLQHASYHYTIMPAPETGIGGRFNSYLGRMPSGTLLEIVSIRQGKRGGYIVKPISKVSEGIQGNINRKTEPLEEALEDQFFGFYSVWGGIGIYEEGEYYDGAPRLNRTWFEIIDLKE